MVKKITPVLVVDAIEPVLPLWDALGFARTAEVPHGDRLGFVILAAGGLEVMYQTVDSVRADNAAALEGPRPIGAAALFIEVDDLAAAEASFPAGTDVIVRQRKTFYGSTETILRDAAGNVITLAQFQVS
ncbi:MAG: VOC family protein [Acidobacteriota bacterium]